MLLLLTKAWANQYRLDRYHWQKAWANQYGMDRYHWPKAWADQYGTDWQRDDQKLANAM